MAKAGQSAAGVSQNNPPQRTGFFDDPANMVCPTTKSDFCPYSRRFAKIILAPLRLYRLRADASHGMGVKR
jgi:hypothetical protein